MNKKIFMKKAIDLSLYSINNGGGPFGAIIVDNNNNIIGEGYNQVTLNNDPTCHAEIVSIRNACKNIDSYKLNGCTIYTSCEPCPMCLSAIYWSRIDKIYYSNTRLDAKKINFDDDFIYNEINKPINERNIVMEKIEDKDAINSFLLWNKKNDKIEY
jgi:tRNA(Arg) A34 adenosine deaminase TadA